jgi:glutathione S-transferase
VSASLYPILYSFRRCPYAMRARLALWQCGVHVVLREVVLRDKPPQLLAVSPKATVPVLVLPNGLVIEQSLDIMRWALQQSDPAGWLDTDLPAQLALIAQHDAQFKPLLDRYKYPERHPEISAVEHQYQAMYWLEQHINTCLHKYTHLMGSQFSLADAAIAPFIRQFAAVDNAWFVAQANPRLQAWLSNIVHSPLFNAIMDKYPQWHSGDDATIFAPATPAARALSEKNKSSRPIKL